MSALAAFAFGEQLVRIADQNGEPWFVGADVCASLGVSKARNALSRLPDDEKGALNVGTPGGEQQMIIISEPGMYRLVLTSRTEKAEAFKKWVVSEVLPSLRRTGRYELPRAANDAAEPGPDALALATADGRLQMAARLDFVRAAQRTYGREAARRAWTLAGLPCVLPERAEEELADIDPTIRDWIATRLEAATGQRVQSSVAYADYCRMCRREGLGFTSQTMFSRTLARIGYRARQSSNVYWQDVRLRPDIQVTLAS